MNGHPLRVRSLPGAGLLTALLVLSGCGGGAGDEPSDKGERLYAMHCAVCHQRDGRGLAGTQPSLAGSATVSGDAAALIGWVALGERAPTMSPKRSVVVMPQFPWLSDDDLAAVLSYVRRSFGNAGPAVTPAEVAAVREAGRRP